jgi:hypothetical protein
MHQAFDEAKVTPAVLRKLHVSCAFKHVCTVQMGKNSPRAEFKVHGLGTRPLQCIMPATPQKSDSLKDLDALHQPI